MTVSVLVAFRDSEDGHRGRVWDFVRALLERQHPDFEISVGTDEATPFCKTRAINRAARTSSGDILVIADADTWCPPEQVAAAVDGAVTRRWWRPYARKVKLTARDTEAALRAGPEVWRFTYDRRQAFERTTTFWAAPPIVLGRELFDGVGGMDERFDKGWGMEDEAFACALRALYGPPQSVPGCAVHLWHPRLGVSGRDMWPGQEEWNIHVPLAQSYQRAMRRPEAMRRLLSREGTDG